MNLDTYQQAAANTAGGEHREERAFLGIYGELEEYANDQDRDTDELGDVAWYLADLCTVYRWSLDSLMFESEPGHRVNLAEARKKYLRGDYDVREYENRLRAGIATKWRWLEDECRRRHISLDIILRDNIHKLEGRKQRGTITGDGHDR